MTPDGASIQPLAGRLVPNLLAFARLLRSAGLPVGPDRIASALQAVEAVGIDDRRAFYWALHGTLVGRRDHDELFNQAFRLYWRNPKLLQKMVELVIPNSHLPRDPEAKELAPRLTGAMDATPRRRAPQPREAIEPDGSRSFSPGEALAKRDFEKMSLVELAEAKQALARMRLPVEQVPTRRYRPDAAGPRIDLRATMRVQTRGSGPVVLRRKSRRTATPPIVILGDVSGSMNVYARVFLHFMHAVSNDRDRVHTFLFGTRLTNVTRELRHRDVDIAVDAAAAAVVDWGGGTRIGQCLRGFNLLWSRRVLGQGAIVLFISDGLDRDAGAGLGLEMERLHKSCRRLIWLNPLLRYDAFEPKSLGMRAILPHVDEFRPVHNLQSLAQLIDALAGPAPRRGIEKGLAA